MESDHMASGSFWSEAFIRQLDSKGVRDAFAADQIRMKIALLIRDLREKRGWSQAELGRRLGKPQSVISRIEDPDYGKLTLQTLFEVAGAFDLPVMIDLPEWEDWFLQMWDIPAAPPTRLGFSAERLVEHMNRRLAALSAFFVQPKEQTEESSVRSHNPASPSAAPAALAEAVWLQALNKSQHADSRVPA
jgi:transcriptional regulator with XRE-family HTH domain